MFARPTLLAQLRYRLRAVVWLLALAVVSKFGMAQFGAMVEGARSLMASVGVVFVVDQHAADSDDDDFLTTSDHDTACSHHCACAHATAMPVEQALVVTAAGEVSPRATHITDPPVPLRANLLRPPIS